MKFTSIPRPIRIIAAVVAVAVTVTACTQTGPTEADSQTQSENVVETYQQSAERGAPYPLAAMVKGGWLERTLLTENLLRQNDRNRLAYVILMNNVGQPIIQYPIQGMVFSLNSQLTVEDKINYSDCGSSCGNAVATKSPGDNGTWGPEPDGIGFFTTEGVEIKWNGLYLESDSPQNLITKPLIVYDAASAKPSVTAGAVNSTADGGIKVSHDAPPAATPTTKG